MLVLLVTPSADLARAVERAAALVGAQVEVRPGPTAVAPPGACAVLVGPGCSAEAPAADQLGIALSPAPAGWRGLVLPADAPVLVEALAASSRARPRPPGARVVAVVPGAGGAGASTAAVALALAAARRGGRPALLDLDPLGAGSALLLDAADVPGLRWPDLAGVGGGLPPAALAAGAAEVDGVRVVVGAHASAGGPPGEPPAGAPTAAPTAEVVAAVVEAALALDPLVLLDVPRWAALPLPSGGAGSVREADAVDAADVVLVVVPATALGTASALRLLPHLDARAADLRVVVRSVPGGLAAEAVSQACGLPLAGRLPHDRAASRARGDVVPGRGARSALSRAADEVLAGLAARGRRPRAA